MKKPAFFLSFLLIFLLAAFESCFIVNEIESVFVIQLGKIVQKIDNPGVHFKIPFIQAVARFDKRILHVESPEKEVISLDQKRLIVDAYVKYQISDSKMFFESLHNEAIADKKIASVLESSLRQAVANHELIDLVNDGRNEIIQEIKQLISSSTLNFGISIVDVRIIKTDLPNENSDAIFQRMISDRQKEATELRAEGDELSNVIKSKADKDADIIVSNGILKSREILAKAEARSQSIQNDSFVKDPEFFAFYESMNVLKHSFNDKQIIMSSKSGVLKLLSE